MVVPGRGWARVAAGPGAQAASGPGDSNPIR